MTFTLNGATITARPLTIGDDEEAYELARMVRPSPDSDVRVRHITFGTFMVGADIDGAFPVPLVRASDPLDTVRAAYEAYRKLPRTFPAQWEQELAEVEGAAKNE